MLANAVANYGRFFAMRNKPAIAAGQSIRAVREMAGLTIAEASEVTGRSAGYLSQVETGKAPNVSEKYIANTISKLCAYISASPSSKFEHAA